MKLCFGMARVFLIPRRRAGLLEAGQWRSWLERVYTDGILPPGKGWRRDCSMLVPMSVLFAIHDGAPESPVAGVVALEPFAENFRVSASQRGAGASGENVTCREAALGGAFTAMEQMHVRLVPARSITCLQCGVGNQG